MLEDLKSRQDHNHRILVKVTELERKALDSIGDMELFEELIQKIDSLQKQYKIKEVK